MLSNCLLAWVAAGVTVFVFVLLPAALCDRSGEGESDA